MHNLSQDSSIPAFLAKLWRLVEDTNTNSLITWSSVLKNYKTILFKSFSRKLRSACKC